MSLTVVNPISRVFMGLLDGVKGEYPSLQSTFDPSLQLETSVRGLRAIRSAYKVVEGGTFPLLAYSRTAFVPDDNFRWHPMSRAMPAYLPVGGVPSGFKDASVMPGSFTANFRLYAGDPAELEYYELLYNTKQFLSNHDSVRMDFDVGVGGLGVESWPVQWQWGGLEDFVFEKEPVHMSLAGQVECRTSLIALDDPRGEVFSAIRVIVRDIMRTESVYGRNLDAGAEDPYVSDSDLGGVEADGGSG